MATVTNLPHIKNIKSGYNKYDPVHKSIFEVAFTLPEALQSTFQEDAAILTQQVASVSGLDALTKTTGVGEQKHLGVTVSFANPVMDTTAADLTIVFNLNLRDVTDNFVLKVFQAWEQLNYNLSDGTRGIKTDYISDNLRIAEANRNGQIWRAYIFHNLILSGVSGLNDLDYTSNDAVQLTTTFRADYWDYDIA